MSIGVGTRVAPKAFTVMIPANHPALFCLGGEAFQLAASDLVGRVRKAAATAQIKDPDTRKLMDHYQMALSTARGPGELLTKLRERGVTEFHGTDYGNPGESLSALLRECANAIDRADANKQASALTRQNRDASSAKVPSDARSGKARKAPKSDSAELQRQPGFKLPIRGGKAQPSSVDRHVDPQEKSAQLTPKRRTA